MTNPINPCCIADDRLDDFFWIVGWLEGEGAFYSDKRGNPHIQAGITDEDVLRRAALILGAGSIFHSRGVKEHHKDQWRIKITSQRAIDWMDALFEHMGSRRKQQITVAIEKADARPGHARGSKNGNSKLGEQDVLAIRRELVDGKTFVALAKEYKVHPSAISHIAAGRSWKHIA